MLYDMKPIVAGRIMRKILLVDVKSIMEGCGGTVAAESEIGKGTSVILTFPVRSIG
jgi:hypothetical protein